MTLLKSIDGVLGKVMRWFCIANFLILMVMLAFWSPNPVSRRSASIAISSIRVTFTSRPGVSKLSCGRRSTRATIACSGDAGVIP